jgi:endoglucanase
VTYNNAATPTTLRSTADTYVRDGGSAGLNFGSLGTLELKKDATGYNREIWLKFDLSSVSSIGTGKLRLYGKIDSATQSPLVSVYSSAGTSWTETGLTFNNRPAAGTTALASTTVSTSTAKYYEWDVTSYLKAEKALGHNLVTLVLRSQTITTPQLLFNSDEAALNPPQLQITP